MSLSPQNRAPFSTIPERLCLTLALVPVVDYCHCCPSASSKRLTAHRHVLEATTLKQYVAETHIFYLFLLAKKAFLLSRTSLVQHRHCFLNPLKPNDAYIGRTAPLTSRSCILYIYSTNIHNEYFKYAAHSQFFLFKMPFIL